MTELDAKKAELDQIFEEAKNAHFRDVKLFKFSIGFGIFAVSLCGVVGAIHGLNGRTWLCFLMMILFLFDSSLIRFNYKRMKRENKEWADFEMHHNYVMEHWEELNAQEMRTIADDIKNLSGGSLQ